MSVNYTGALTNSARPIISKQFTESLAIVHSSIIDFNSLVDLEIDEDELKEYNLTKDDFLQKDTYSYGALRFRYLSQREADEPKLGVAFPFDTSYISLPVAGEIVEIVTVSGVNYYKKLKYNNSANYDSVPYLLQRFNKKTAEGSSDANNQQNDIKEVSSTGITNTTQSANNTKKYRPDFQGDYFKRDLRVHQLSLREGDTIIQGRFGNTIRFSGYMHDNTQDGAYNPVIMIRNGENAENKSKKVYDVVDEDINTDGTSIQITSGDYTTKYVPTYTGTTRYSFPSEAKGEQMIVNSDRITISSKGENVYLFSNQNISLAANNVVSVEASELDFTAYDGAIRMNAMGKNNIVIGVENGKVLLGADNTENSVEANQMVLGNKLIVLIDKLIQAINLMTIATPSGPSSPGPIDKATFNQLGKELKDCLSKTNYLV